MYKSEKFWNKLSKNYDVNGRDKTFDMIINRTKKHLKPNFKILDFACATGLFSFEFADSVTKIDAFDISSKMIEKAKKNASECKSNTITFSQTTVFDNKFTENSYNAVLAYNILLYFENINNELSRINDLLCKDGVLITSTACLKEKRSFLATIASGVIYVLRGLKILPNLTFYKMKELEKIIIKNGFDIIETTILIDSPATEYFIVAKKVN